MVHLSMHVHLTSNFRNKSSSNEDKVLRKRLKSQFSYRQHRVFITWSKLWSTSQRHTVSESTTMPFIPRQYSWDYRHEHERRK